MAVGTSIAQAPVATAAPLDNASPPANWSGPYVGLAGGGALGNSNQIDAGPFGYGATTHGYGIDGGIFGGTAGYNFQTGPWVYGLDGDFSWINARGQAHEIAPFTTSTVEGTDEDWLGTARVRFGWTASNRVLLYATGGFAVASVKATVEPFNARGLAQTETRWGGTVGAGVETMLDQNWSVKAEYLHVDMVRASYFDPSRGPTFNIRGNVPVDNDIFRLGLNYHF